MLATNLNPAVNPAIVARHSHDVDADEYLVLAPTGAVSWTGEALAATAFCSMREATRTALRLAGSGRAFALPLRPELTLRGWH